MTLDCVGIMQSSAIRIIHRSVGLIWSVFSFA